MNNHTCEHCSSTNVIGRNLLAHGPHRGVAASRLGRRRPGGAPKAAEPSPRLLLLLLAAEPAKAASALLCLLRQGTKGAPALLRLLAKGAKNAACRWGPSSTKD